MRLYLNSKVCVALKKIKMKIEDKNKVPFNFH